MRIAVYTCITNGVDNLIEDQPDGADYYVFSDIDPQSKRWKFMPIDEVSSDPRRIARYYKTLSHKFFPKYDATIWMDGSIKMLKNPHEVVKLFLKGAGIGTYIHPRRRCTYKEALVCKDKKLDFRDVISAQMKKYRDASFPENYGLAETKVVVRDNSIQTKLFNIHWFNEINSGSKRCQLSMKYVEWFYKIKVNNISPPIADHGFFKFMGHAKTREETNKMHYDNLD
jgi:hypothetical protein